jgi:hypothetical protein
VLQLWCHECMRIIADRMWDKTDKDWLVRQLDERLGATFSTTFGTLFEHYGESVPPFVTFMRQARRAPAGASAASSTGCAHPAMHMKNTPASQSARHVRI